MTPSTPAQRETGYWRGKRGVHVINPIANEYMLCGDAFDGNPGDSDEPMEMVEPQRITCSKCREIIACCRKL